MINNSQRWLHKLKDSHDSFLKNHPINIDSLEATHQSTYRKESLPEISLGSPKIFVNWDSVEDSLEAFEERL